MPPVVTSNATIVCAHGGQVVLIPRQTTVTIDGGAVLCEGDLIGAPIAGCLQAPSPGSAPCTSVLSTLPGSTSLEVLGGGRPAHVATLTGMTDGVPPAAIEVGSAGQASVQG